MEMRIIVSIVEFTFISGKTSAFLTVIILKEDFHEGATSWMVFFNYIFYGFRI